MNRMMMTVVAAVGCAMSAIAVPWTMQYEGEVTEAKPSGGIDYAFKAPDGTNMRLRLSKCPYIPTKFFFSEYGHFNAPKGMWGLDGVVKPLDDGRVIIAYANPERPDSKVYGFRMIAWIGPWASLKEGSTRGFYRVDYARPNAVGVWLPDVKATDAKFREHAEGLAKGTGGWDDPIEVDLAADEKHFTVICESPYYDAHPSSIMLPDEKTFYCFWDLAHGGPTGPSAKSTDGGLTWTRFDDNVPAEFKKFHDAPVSFRFIDPKTGKARLRVFAGYGEVADGPDGWRGPAERPLEEAMPSIMSEDEGKTWKYMPGMGSDFRCVISFFGMEQLKDGSYLGVYHRGPQMNGGGSPLEVLGTFSRDGGLTWEKPFLIARDERYDLCEPAVFYSPDKSELCMLIRENKGKGLSQMCFSKDDGKTWTKIQDAPVALNGHRHVPLRLQDGRYLIVLRRVDFSRPDVIGWVGPYESIRDGSGKGGYLVKIVRNHGSPFDCGYQSVHMKSDGEIMVNTYAKFRPWRNETPSIVSERFHIEEADALVAEKREFWADQLAAIDEAKKGVAPTKEQLAATMCRQGDWYPFGKLEMEKKGVILKEAEVYGFVRKGENPLELMQYLPKKKVKHSQGVIDVTSASGAWAAAMRPWWAPGFAAYVKWEYESAEEAEKTLWIKNDYFGKVFINGKQLPSSYDTAGKQGYGPFYGSWTDGVKLRVKFQKGKNEIILLTSPGSTGQWISAAAIEN